MGYKKRTAGPRKAVKALASGLDVKARESYKLPLWRRLLSRFWPQLAERHWQRWERRHMAALRKTTKRVKKGLT
jgi:hypothetical protein